MTPGAKRIQRWLYRWAQGGNRWWSGPDCCAGAVSINRKPGIFTGGLDNQSVALPSNQQQGEYRGTAQEQELFDFASVVLADIEDTWNTLLPREGHKYGTDAHHLFRHGELRLRHRGFGVGPFYCPRDHTIYLVKLL